MSEPANITAFPAKAFRGAIVLDDECQECKGPLGEDFHVQKGYVAICRTCFSGKVNMRNVIDTDSYRELPE